LELICNTLLLTTRGKYPSVIEAEFRT